jgi:poly(3-hydroxyalkanoate) synthetase
MTDAARVEFERAMQRNLKGLEYFQTSGPTLGATRKDVLIERGTMRLYHYHPRTDDVYRVPILLVMATTNRGYIFDMVPGQSLVEYLHPDAGLANLVTFTTPVDFSRMEMFQSWADRRFFDVDKLVDTFGNCPGDYLYTAFDLLRPAARAGGNVRLYDNLWNDDFVKSYRMFDRWSSDTLPLAGEYFRETTKKLMWGNQLYEGGLEVGGMPVDLATITVPFLHVAAEHDHIVPPAASAPLVGMVGSTDKQEMMLKGGHVSLVAGGNAIKRLWPNLVAWLGERST